VTTHSSDEAAATGPAGVERHPINTSAPAGGSMAAIPCNRCGGLAPVGAAFCPFCGASVRPSALPPSPLATAGPGVYSAPSLASSGGPPSGAPPYGYAGWSPSPMTPGGAPAPSAGTRGADLAALAYVGWAAVMLLVSGAAGLLVFVLPSSQFSAVEGSSLGADYHFGIAFYAILIASGALAIVEIGFLRAAFHRLAPVDPRFSTPSKLALVLLIGAVLTGVGLVIVLHTLQTLGNCSIGAAGGLTGDCKGLANLAVGELFLLPGAILALLGYIGCLLGLWRCGDRYQESAFKVGTVLLILPVLSVAGAILLLLTARSARTKLAGAVVGMTSFP
jgi:Protein of unknown function (DUF973)